MRLGDLALPTATLAAFVWVWDPAARHYPPEQFPGPLDVARALGELAADGTLWANTWISLARFVTGYLLAVVVAMPLGLLLGRLVPAAFPGIMVGLHIAVGTAWIHLVAGEMLGAQAGLGYMIVDARNFLRTDVIMAGMLVVGLLGLAIYRGMRALERVIGRHWGLSR